MADLACALLGPDAGGAVRAAGEPLHAGARWSDAERWRLIGELGAVSWEHAARKHGRTVTALKRALDKSGGRNRLQDALGVSKAAAIAGCSVQYIARLCRQGRIKARKLDRRWVLDDDDFHERWLTAWEARHG